MRPHRLTICRLANCYARFQDIVGDADCQNSRMVMLLSEADAKRIQAIEAIQSGEPGRAVALLLEQGAVIQEAHAEEQGDIEAARELRNLLGLIGRILKEARKRVRIYRLAGIPVRLAGGEPVDHAAGSAGWREAVVPAAPLVQGQALAAAAAAPEGGPLMDAARIDHLMGLSPLYGDPDEDREFTAADLEPEPQRETAPTCEVEAA